MENELPVPARFFRPDLFKGDVCVVTGGGTGLGLEISRSLAALGATVIIASRSTEHHAAFLEESNARGWNTEALVLDVRESDEVHEVAKGIVERHGQVDVLINNAAGNFVCPAEKLSPRAWRAVLGIVLDGTFYCSRSFGKHMIKRGEGGRMLNVVATYAWTGMPGVVHSASAKAGVWAMTKTLAAEWARFGIRVNSIAPGPFQSDGARANLWPDQETEDRIIEKIPAGRFATREEVTRHALHLLAKESDYITGECMVVDGGLSLSAGRMWEPGAKRNKHNLNDSSDE
ncbi:MAG: NAD(P)-dependent dehydrogenase (short-subunit alcohol dehydrogenase family) [Planctomycetota bacterium]|jgi:NAD(P)-dependent dehydrogenase (short-subunit alcohol dehydrogenase family)